MGLAGFIAKLSRRWRKGNWGSEPASARLGREGERLAARHLKRHGYRILRRNFRPKRGGEIDLVCRELATDTLVFVEVKTRSSDAFGRPSAAVDRNKRRRIVRGALAWLRMLGNPDVIFRFDIVEVLAGEGKPRIEILRGAFHLPEPLRY